MVLALVAEVWVSWPQVRELGRADPDIVCHGAAQAEVTLPPTTPLTTFSSQVSYPQGHELIKASPDPYQLQLLGELGPAPCLDRTTDLTLVVEAQVSQD